MIPRPGVNRWQGQSGAWYEARSGRLWALRGMVWREVKHPPTDLPPGDLDAWLRSQVLDSPDPSRILET